MSPVAFSVRSKSPCTANSSSMWSRNGSPVRTLALPVPSSVKRTCTSVSFVLRARRAPRAAGRAPRAAGISAAPRSCASLHRCAVKTHALMFGDRRTGARETAQVAAQRHATRPAHEVLDPKRGRPACGAAGRQGVIRPRDVIPEGDGRPHADEDRAGVAYLGGQGGRAAAREQHVLGSGLV